MKFDNPKALAVRHKRFYGIFMLHHEIPRVAFIHAEVFRGIFER